MKPRIYKQSGAWWCVSRGMFGVRVIGGGFSPSQAYGAWAFNRNHSPMEAAR